MTSSELQDTCKDPISKQGRIHRPQGLGFSISFFSGGGGHTSTQGPYRVLTGVCSAGWYVLITALTSAEELRRGDVMPGVTKGRGPTLSLQS